MSKTTAWIILSLFGALMVWALVIGIDRHGFVKVATDVGIFAFICVAVIAGLFALAFAFLFVKDRMNRAYRRWLRPAPWVKPFAVSQAHEAELYDALKSRLEMIERNDEERSETYLDRETGQRWRNQYVEQGFGSWYELRPEPLKGVGS